MNYFLSDFCIHLLKKTNVLIFPSVVLLISFQQPAIGTTTKNLVQLYKVIFEYTGWEYIIKQNADGETKEFWKLHKVEMGMF